MATLRLDDVVAVGRTQDIGDAEPGARTADRDHAVRRKGLVGAAEMQETVVMHLRCGMADRAEIVDQDELVHLEALAHQRRADDPGIVGQLDQVAADRRGHGNGGRAGHGAIKGRAERLPRSLQAGIFGGLQGRGLAERDDTAFRDLGDGKRT